MGRVHTNKSRKGSFTSNAAFAFEESSFAGGKIYIGDRLYRVMIGGQFQRNQTKGEDRVVCEETSGVFAVFDGHNGSRASEVASRAILAETGEERIEEKEIRSVFRRVQRHVRDADIEMKENYRKKSIGGSTAVVLFVSKDAKTSRCRARCANCGDSHAVLFRKGGDVVQLSEDHRPIQEHERKRIKRDGGKVDVGLLADEDGDGVLSVSRGFGNFRVPGFSCEPYVSDEIDLLDPKNEFVVLGSDGLWDNVSSEDVAGQVRGDLGRGVVDPSILAKHLCELAVESCMDHKRRLDDISVIVVLLGVAASRATRERQSRRDENQTSVMTTPVKR